MSNLGVERVEIPHEVGGDHGTFVPGYRTMEGFTLQSGGPEGVAIDSLEAGATLLVQTTNSFYRFVVLDGPQHLVLVKGGAMFPEDTPVRLAGATAGGSALKLGWIVVGLRIEMSLGHRRIMSSRVRSIAIESVPPVHRSHQFAA